MYQWEELGNNIYSHRYEALNQTSVSLSGPKKQLSLTLAAITRTPTSSDGTSRN